MKECVTHHFACQCREERFRKVLELAAAGLFLQDELDRPKGTSFYDLEDPGKAFDKLDEATQALTQEDKDWILEELKK